MFKMSAFSVDTGSQTTSLINGVIHSSLFQSTPVIRRCHSSSMSWTLVWHTGWPDGRVNRVKVWWVRWPHVWSNEGNRRSGVALATRQRHYLVVLHLRAQGLYLSTRLCSLVEQGELYLYLYIHRRTQPERDQLTESSVQTGRQMHVRWCTKSGSTRALDAAVTSAEQTSALLSRPADWSIGRCINIDLLHVICTLPAHYTIQYNVVHLLCNNFAFDKVK